MRIMFCIDSLTKGGAERVVSVLANWLSEKGNDIEIVTFSGLKPQYPLDKKIKVVDLNQTNGNKITKLFGRVKSLKNEYSSFNPDVILSFLPYASMIALLANKRDKRKLIVSVRNDPNTEYKPLKYKYLKHCLYPKVDGFVMQTKEMKDYFSKTIQDKSVVIPNPVSDSFLGKAYSGKRNKEIVSVGRLYEQKNHKLLIDSFSELPSRFDDYKLIIYGEGYLRNELQSYIAKKGLQNRVLLAGKVDDVANKIRKSACFVLSSDYEGMPNALMEAMALGLPVVSTDCPCGGPKELIQNGKNGVLVEIDSREELKNAIVKILDDDSFSSKISNNAQKITDVFNSDVICKKWDKTIMEISNA